MISSRSRPVLVAPDKFKGTLSAPEAAVAIGRGLAGAGVDRVELLPLSDGGEGTVEAIVRAKAGRIATATVSGPLGEPVTAAFGLLDEGRTALVEMGQASGLWRVPPERRYAWSASSRGTGELIADAIHYNSPRAQNPFIKVNCAALPESLIESELFGYEKGAFTGANSLKKGRFELAESGTLFLDEIGDMNLATQVKLLRVLQEKECERLGGTTTVRANVRLITGTNKDLEKAMAESHFREDLYYRLNVFTIFVPPLRERKSADHFLQKYAREHEKDIRRISTPAIDMLTAYHWPGNVRELENVIERAVLVCDANVVHGHHLPPTLQTPQASGTLTTLSLSEAVAAYEKDIVVDALKTTRGNRAKAARLLRTTERIINYKVRKYSIDKARFRN